MMQGIIKARWWIMTGWIAVAAALFILAPPLGQLVKQHGTITVPDGYPSSDAAAILEEAARLSGETSGKSIAFVFHREGGIGEADRTKIEQAMRELDTRKAEFDILQVLHPFERKELEEKMISADGTTILATVTVTDENRSLDEILQRLDDRLANVPVDHYMTGQELIDRDMIISSQEGLKKSEYFTVAFILLILIAVFRSVVAPFIPLLTVGISYFVSQSIVAFLVEQYQFPVSTFTQIFMVAVMFGIGTDYCILLISRFKEELVRSGDTRAAIIATYRTAGKTVLFSGLAVLVGFFVIGLSQFILYRSAVAVAVGIAVMLAALLTVVPFFMAVLGKAIFWPSGKRSLDHKESRIWGLVGSFSLKRPILALLAVAVIMLPFLLTYGGNLSFNSVEEIGEKYESVKAFNLIADKFEPGETMPTQIVLRHNGDHDDAAWIALSERISRELLKVEGVAQVRGLSRPAGDEIEEFKIAEQVKTLRDGLGEGNEGLNAIREGLSQAGNSLEENGPKLQEAVQGASQLSEGTEALKAGMDQLKAGLTRIEQGIRSGSGGAGQLKAGLNQVKESASQLKDAQQTLLATYRQLGAGLSQIDGGLAELSGRLQQVAASLQGLQPRFANLEQKYPELAQDEDYLVIRATVEETSKGTEQLAAMLNQLSAELSRVSDGLEQANQGYAQAAQGQEALAKGLDGLIRGAAQLEGGLAEAAQGQKRVISEIPQVIRGLDELKSGQEQLEEGFGRLTEQLNQLTNGLKDSVDGLTQVAAGLDSAGDYLSQVASESDDELGGWFVPEEVMANEDFALALDQYLSSDRHVMTLDVVFADNPYGAEAIDRVDEVSVAVERALQNTPFAQAEIGIGGVSGTYNDLQTISDQDYNRTVVFMLIGILLILIILLRSFVMPAYLIVSLLATYYTSMGVTEWIFVDLLGYSGVSWPVPFFSFVMLIALGVDYSIFLMDRFNENKHLGAGEAVLHAMKNMGTVIISAAIILGGTFASFYPSGVMAMMQIATVVLAGLALYTFLFMPFFIPVMVRLFGQANWWPFGAKDQAEAPQHSRSMARQEGV
jgi:RND superfamily putative drug exporter